MEIWKDIEGFEGLYQVSNLGRVKSLARQTGTVFRKERILNADNRLTKDGYRRVSLARNGKSYERRVCRLVAQHFVPLVKGKNTVNHKNGIKTDDRAENLEWATRSENMKHAYKHNLKKAMRGTENPNAKLTEEQVKEVRKRFTPYCRKNGASALAREFGVTHRVILLVAKNKSYKQNNNV